MAKTKFFHRIHTKVIAVFAISLIPLLLVGFFIFSNNYNLLKNEIINSRNQSIGMYSEKIFASLERTQKKMIQLINCDDATELIIKKDDISAVSDSAHRLQEQMNFLCVSEEYADSICLIFESGAFVSNTEIRINGSDKQNHYYSLLKNAKSNFVYDSENEKFYMLSTSPFFFPVENDKPSITAFVCISKSKIENDMLNFCSLDSNFSKVLILHNSTDIVLGDNETINNIESIGLDSFTSNISEFKVNDQKVWVSDSYSSTLGLDIILYMSKLPFSFPTKNLMLFVLLLIIILIFVIFLDVKFFRSILATPLNILTSAFEKLDSTGYTAINSQFSNDEFGYIFEHFNKLVKEFKESIESVYELRLRTKEAEFKHLQVQINPHFLYNGLYTLSLLVKNNQNELASKLAEYLSAYYRYITKTGISCVTIEEELSHIKNYADIICLRYSDRVKFNIINNCHQNNLMIPKLIIQPLVENAFEHGMKDTLSDGEIEVLLYEENNMLIINVKDNGGNITQDTIDGLYNTINCVKETDEMTGLSNVNKRLKIFFGEDSGLNLFINQDEEFVSQIKINLNHLENNILKEIK